MSKRSLSPSEAAELPPSKRLHGSSHSAAHPSPQRTFDTLLSDELVLFIFSYLSWPDLCAAQSTNRNWSRLALDNQLWKTLYLSEYGRARLRGGRGFIGRGDGREIKPLPGRVKELEPAKDWKWMFRISSNWRIGRCSVEQFAVSPSCPAHEQANEQTFVLLSGNITITASSRVASPPTILLSSPGHAACALPCSSSRADVPMGITALALDQSPPTSGQHTRLACFLSAGEVTFFNINHTVPSSSTRLPACSYVARNVRSSPIIQAAYHHPLLVTLSETFRLSLLSVSPTSVTHTQSLTSFTSYPPSSLVLSAPSPTTFKVILSYAIPVYPHHWTIGATELIVSAPDMTASSTRTIRAIDIPQGWLDEHKMRAVREQWGRKVPRVAATQTDGKWVVLAPGQNPPPYDLEAQASVASSPSRRAGSTFTSSSLHSISALQLYRLHLPAGPSAPKLTFVRSLYGHTGPVSTLALADGRCVSLGVNGSLWVWDLEGGTGTEVSCGLGTTEEAEEYVKARMVEGAHGTVVFDDRRIVSADCRGVELRRFDI